MSSGSSNSSILNMPDYGQGLAEALQAQTDALSGSLTGTPLQQTVEQYERPLRMSAAQIDNDVLRQTLLGGQVPIYESVSSDNLVERRVSQPGEGGQVTQIDYGGAVTKDGRVIIGDDEVPQSIRDLQEIYARDGNNTAKLSSSIKEWVKTADLSDFDTSSVKSVIQSARPGLKGVPGYFDKGTETGLMRSVVAEAILYNTSNTLKSFLDNYGKPEPIYKKNEDGTDFVVPRDENGDFILEATSETEIPEGGVAAPAGELTGYTRAGTGLVDMLGDTRNVQEFTTRQATEEDVAAGLASEVGESITEASGNRQSGFDADGSFLGLAALAEDIQRGNLSRQREADLADVERLSDRFQTVMEDYKPGTTSGLDDARLLLEQQRENLTGLREATQADVDAGTATAIGEMIQTGRGGPVTIPTGSTYGGDITASTMNAAQVADSLALSANTQFGGELATGQTATGEDTLRSALLGDARTALGQGLTDRETRSIQDAARARSTMMGRTFDQSGAIAEAEARVQEDNARRMQNRSFAQSVLGQEAGIQQGDITRGMAQESEQAGLQQRTDLAQAQMDQQANAFDADAAMRAATVNQGQQQQAAQFGVGAQMDAERLNEQLRQQGLGNYINAIGNLAQIEDSYTLDPFQALLGRGGGGSLQAGQGVFGQAGYGLQSGPQYLNPEAGLGYISQMAANDANMYAANVSANASRNAGLMGGLGALGGGLAQGVGAAGSVGAFFCWVAREVYGPTNPAWLQFREWMFTESPNWFFKLYAEYGERFANWISNKPRIKSIIRKWMDSKIGGK
jgi:hypothetical protein